MQYLYTLYELERDENFVYGVEEWDSCPEEPKLETAVHTLEGNALAEGLKRLEELYAIRPSHPIGL